MEAGRGEKRTYDEMMNEEPSTSHHMNCNGALQTGSGEKRSHDEVDDEDNERPFTLRVSHK